MDPLGLLSSRQFKVPKLNQLNKMGAGTQFAPRSALLWPL